MQTYIVEYNYVPWGKGGLGFSADYPSELYYKYETAVIKAQNIDNLRARIISELAKGKPFRSHVYRMTADGRPNYDAKMGDLYHYPDAYTWFIRSTKSGYDVNPKNGKLIRR